MAPCIMRIMHYEVNFQARKEDREWGILCIMSEYALLPYALWASRLYLLDRYRTPVFQDNVCAGIPSTDLRRLRCATSVSNKRGWSFTPSTSGYRDDTVLTVADIINAQTIKAGDVESRTSHHVQGFNPISITDE